MLEKERALAAAAALEEAAPVLLGVYRKLDQSRDPGLDALEAAVDNLWTRYLSRLEDAARPSPIKRAQERFDRALRTERLEWMDRDDCPEDRREKLLLDLHKLNVRLGTYRNCLRRLEPTLQAAQGRTGRTPRLLDLASGWGGFPIEIGKLAEKRGIPLEATGSDVRLTHVEGGNRRAREAGAPVSFRRVNAFRIEELEEGEYDVLTIIQAIHHFSAGQIARMIAEAVRVSTTGFVGIDFMRTPLIFLAETGLPLAAGTLNPYFFHDAFVSGRKFLHAVELEMIARAAAPQAEVRCEVHLPGYNVLRVIRPEAQAAASPFPAGGAMA